MTGSRGSSTDELLAQLVERLRKAYGEGLISVVLYGSAAAGDYQTRFSDLNVLCILRDLALSDLGHGQDVFRWWRERGNPSPLLLTEEEMAASTDCFPIEFADLHSHRRILFGADLIESLPEDRSFYRVQVEYELRAKLLRLRQKAAGMLADPDLLRRLLADSVSTFCVLFRHALALYGETAPASKRDTLQRAKERFGIDPQPFDQLLNLREERIRPRDVEPVGLLAPCLRGITQVIDAVDRLEK